MERLRAISTDIAQRYSAIQEAVGERNRLILEAHAAGETQAAIAEAAGLSPQRINQLVYDSEEQDNGQPH